MKYRLELTCPHCQQPALRWWQKLTLWPVNTRLCQQCHRPVTTSLATLFTLLPLASALFFIKDMQHLPLMIMIWLLAVLVALHVQLTLIPLIKKP